MSDDIYDVSKYSEKQLYDLLDISNPTDRELEARILHLIRKYTNIQNEDGIRLLKFFEDIYDHFFQNDEEEDIIEGFDAPTIITGGPTKMIDIPNSETINNPNDKSKKDDEKTKSQLVTSADYIPDTLRLNPLLKQTVKRIICIDSQYRDVSVYPNTNNFAFDLSEPLRDVVSLKLYSIQIPYTWYTISKSYGSNFFYLKGITDGINNGYHDYKIIISAGNYDSKSIVSAINKGFSQVFAQNPDTSFNNTGITYNEGNSISTTIINIQKIYTECYYTLEFPYWTPSTYIIDDAGNTAAIADASRNTSIPSYLGFNYNNYSPTKIFSYKNLYSTIYINNDNKKNFQFDNSNNYFTIIHYIGPSLYNPTSSQVINSYTITLYDIINNTGKPVVSNNQYYFTRIDVVTMVNSAIKNANIFTLDSQISQYDISGNVINANNTCFELKLIFDRNKVLYQPNSNIVAIFPTENPAKYANTTIWKYEQGVANSCFYFQTTNNEFALINAELPVVQSDFTVDVSNNYVYVYYKCWAPSYMAIDGLNDISFSVPKGNYTLNQYVSQLNTSLQTISNSVTLNNTDSKFSLVNSYLNCKMDFFKKFTTSDYIISFDESSVLYKTLGFTIPSSDSSSNIFTGTFPIYYSGYILDSSYVLSVSPNPNSKNKYEPVKNIYLPVTNYANYTQLLNGIYKAITGYTITSENSNVQLPYSQSTLKVTEQTTTQLTTTLTMNVNYLLDETNYIMSFYPYSDSDTTNIWYNFGIEPSYNLYNYVKTSYSEFTGTKQLSQNQIHIQDGQNTILVNANYDPSGGAYTPTGVNNIKITIPVGTYTTFSLCNQIYLLFNENPYTYGSYISSFFDNATNLQHVQLRLNVNRIYTTADYELVFYDPFSFSACNSNLKGVQSATWDTTLGWILGYRDYTKYTLTLSNQTINSDTGIPYYSQSRNSIYEYNEIYKDVSNNLLLTNSVVELSADTTLTTSLYNYFVISLDDYNQNHINDGLVTITRSQTSIQMPSYSSTSMKICDPVTKKLVNRSMPQSNSDNLTENQLYSINQSNSSNNPTVPVFSAGPYIKDLFAYVPIKPGTNGTYFIEYGGGLQLQERLYFGPVNIRKMSIELMTDRGDYLDLNGSNWSFSFICEQLYRSGNSNANK